MHKRPFALLAALFILAAPVHSAEAPQPAARGLWITCIGDSNVLGSADEMRNAVSFAKKSGFGILFVQVFRGDKAWFDSDLAEDEPFQKNRAKVKTDSFRALIEAAHAEGIEVHAWLNTLTLSQNWEAQLLKRFGNSVLTRDQHGRPALVDPAVKEKSVLDKYYMREEQLFLEPGDPNVRAHVAGIVKELAGKYPELDGIHFDYIRYPAAPPYLPGSRFNAIGISYGYGWENVKRFTAETGIDPKDVNWKADESQAWDDWKREQVTSLIREAGGEARKINPKIRISAAVIASFDRAYFAAYQDWTRWVEDGVVDFIALMSYSHDSRYVRLVAKNAIGLVGDPSKVFIGLGAFLMEKRPDLLERQIDQGEALGAGGLIIFDYDSFLKAPGLKAALKKETSPAPAGA